MTDNVPHIRLRDKIRAFFHGVDPILYSRDASQKGKRFHKLSFASPNSVHIRAWTEIGYFGYDYDPHIYYQDWEDQYYNRSDPAASIDTIVDLIFAMTFKFQGKDMLGEEELDPEDPRSDTYKWYDWCKKIGFEDKFRTIVRNTLLFGNGYAIIIKLMGNRTVPDLDITHPRRVYALVDKYNHLYGWEVRDKFAVTTNKLYLRKDMRHILVFRLNRLGESHYGIGLGCQVFDAIENKYALEQVGFVMTHRSSNGLIGGSFDTTDMDDKEEDENGDTEVTRYGKAVALALADRVRVDEDGNYTIINDYVFPDRVKLDTLEVQNDIEGLNMMIQIENRKIRAKLKVPSIYLDEAQSNSVGYNEMIAFCTFLRSVWKAMVIPLKRILELLNIKGKFVYEEIIREIMNTWVLSATRVGFLYQIGTIDLEETRRAYNDLMGWNLNTKKEIVTPLQPVNPASASPNKMRYGTEADEIYGGLDPGLIPCGHHNHHATPQDHSRPPTRTSIHNIRVAFQEAVPQEIWEELERKYRPKLGSVRAEMKVDVADYLKNLAEKNWDKYEKLADKEGIKFLAQTVLLADLLNLVGFGDEGLNLVIRDGMKSAWEAEAVRTGSNIPWNEQTDPVAWLGSDADRHGETITTRLGQEAKQDMVDYLKAHPKGVSRAELKDVLMEKYNGYDIDTLVEHETQRAAVAVGLAGHKQRGVIRVAPLPILDIKTCPICIQFFKDHYENGIDIDKAIGLLPLHPLCRCVWVPHYEMANLTPFLKEALTRLGFSNNTGGFIDGLNALQNQNRNVIGGEI